MKNVDMFYTNWQLAFIAKIFFLFFPPTWGCKSTGTAEVFEDISLAVNVLVKFIPCPIKTWKYVGEKQTKYTKPNHFSFVLIDLWNTSRILEVAKI